MVAPPGISLGSSNAKLASGTGDIVYQVFSSWGTSFFPDLSTPISGCWERWIWSTWKCFV